MIYAIENQSVFDVAVQESGSVLAAFDWALKNGLSLTDDLEPGQQLISPNSDFFNTDVAGYFKGKKQMIATGFNTADGQSIIPTLGIGTMRIGTTFIVG
ncbi:hypothetical protein EKL97_10440 [Flavobacterium sp. LS1P28]|uniref:hypothetical protein n=1 Tax=Flavobacterium sp. LS1P28 TaxID=2497752 RepID=UPI000F81C0D6|nr:hypothetical protein [Flavobacterium sp. LS1P28]RTY80674.1 hypothetical protein EKL97_10440 [Flavobacterium sp. LS1P28]